MSSAPFSEILQALAHHDKAIPLLGDEDGVVIAMGLADSALLTLALFFLASWLSEAAFSFVLLPALQTAG